MPSYYSDDANNISGEPEYLEAKQGSTNFYRLISGRTILDYMLWTQLIYDQFKIDNSTYLDTIQKYAYDSRKNDRPSVQPRGPNITDLYTVTSESFKKGYGQSTSGMFKPEHVGKSFGVNVGQLLDASV